MVFKDIAVFSIFPETDIRVQNEIEPLAGEGEVSDPLSLFDGKELRIELGY